MERDKAILAESLERLGLTEDILVFQNNTDARVHRASRVELYKELKRRGMGYRRISEVCGVNKSTVYYSLARTEALTPREVEIMRLKCSGLKADEIARKMNLNMPTIYKHSANVYAKTGCRNQYSLGVWCERNGILTDVGLMVKA